MNLTAAYVSVGLPFVAVVILGIVIGNPWACLAALAGLLTLNRGMYQPVPNMKLRLLLRTLIGVALLGTATWLANLGAPWMWTFIWVLAAFYMAVDMAAMHRTSPGWGVAVVGTASVLFLIVAVLIPLASYGQLTRASISLLLLIVIVLTGAAASYTLARTRGVTSTRFRVAVLSLLLAAAAVVGYATQNIPSAMLTFAAILFLFKDLRRLAQGAVHKYRAIFSWSAIGLLLLGAATWLDGLRGGWIWAPVWVLAAAALASKAAPLLNRTGKEPLLLKGTTGTGAAAFSAAGLCLLFAAAGPSILAELPVSRAAVTFLLLALGFGAFVAEMLAASSSRPMYFIVCSYAGTVLIAAAAFAGQGAGGWTWTFLWLAGASLIAWEGSFLLPVSRHARAYGIALTVLNALFAVAGPLFGTFYVEAVDSLLTRQPKGEAAVRLVSAGAIPAVLLMFGVAGAFLAVRARKTRSSTPQLDAILAMLGVGGAPQQPVKKPVPRPAQAGRTDPQLDSARAMLAALERTRQLTAKDSVPPPSEVKNSTPELRSVLALLSALDQVKKVPKKQ
jgi:hypothetical protein